MKKKFWKMSGAGNDFILVDGLPKGKSASAVARALCDRRFGIGADGLLVLSRRGEKINLDYRNADGSSAFCGNGSRCAVLWAADKGWLKGEKIELTTVRGPLTARLTGKGRAEVAMPAPTRLRLGKELALDGRKMTLHLVDTGVPHAVVFVPDVDKVDVKGLGRALRFHKISGRAGANVDFVERKGSALVVRTYERGVEDETLACGTGIVAAAFVARVLGFGGSPVKVKTRGGAILSVSFDRGPRLEGPGKVVFTGEVSL